MEENLSGFTLIAAAIAAIISLIKKHPKGAEQLKGRERVASVALALIGAFIGGQTGWLPIAESSLSAYMSTAAALAAASGVAYQQILKMFQPRASSTQARLEKLEDKRTLS